MALARDRNSAVVSATRRLVAKLVVVSSEEALLYYSNLFRLFLDDPTRPDPTRPDPAVLDAMMTLAPLLKLPPRQVPRPMFRPTGLALRSPYSSTGAFGFPVPSTALGKGKPEIALCRGDGRQRQGQRAVRRCPQSYRIVPYCTRK